MSSIVKMFYGFRIDNLPGRNFSHSSKKVI
jgi:hypothetical protein